MNSVRIVIKTLQRASMVIVLVSLAACGEPEDKQCSQTLAVLTAGLCLLGEVSHSSPPQNDPPPNTDTGGTTDTGGDTTAPPSSSTVIVRRFVEYEPNSTLNNANPVSFRDTVPENHIGLDITGSVSQNDDASDFFIFTTPRSGPFLVYLCDGSCGNTLNSDQVYLMVYDQGQNTIASTPVGSVVNQQFSVELTAGLAYYVEVNGYNTGSSRVDYKLVVID